MIKRSFSKIALALCLVSCLGCGGSEGQPPQGEPNETESGQSSSEDESWKPKTNLPDPD